eukprot:gnl/TRDRNA2_/TRDRNA2_177018_c2_seq16.p1 gnl/TRDRNA2_/TRDRNA2_177018_c2~~gnl/TRDRNA2_/TRDRNA2_177018_c2_seq16.p1  ORF type:complete len:500 (-),score=79.28 gnl/TRDRNA2_/TRDRNA2_177018_c2_seq16:127-1551(-)
MPTPEDEILRLLYADAVNDWVVGALSHFQGCARDGNDYSRPNPAWLFEAVGSGYQLSLMSYSEHMPEILNKVADLLKDSARLFAKKGILGRSKQRLGRHLKGIVPDKPEPYALQIQSIRAVTQKEAYDGRELLEALEATTEDLFKRHSPPFGAANDEHLQTNGFRVQFFFTGNIDERSAGTLAAAFVKKIGLKKNEAPRVLDAEEAARIHTLMIDRPVQVRLTNPYRSDPVSSIVNEYQLGNLDASSTVHGFLFGQMLQQKFLKYRTFGQAGDGVSLAKYFNTYVLQIALMGVSKSPDQLDADIEHVLDKLTRSLAEMSQKELDLWKEHVLPQVNQKKRNMYGVTERLWELIVFDDICFSRTDLALAYLDTMSVQDLVKGWDSQMRAHPRKVSARIWPTTTLEGLDKKILEAESKTDELLLGDKAENGVNKVIVEMTAANSEYPYRHVCKSDALYARLNTKFQAAVPGAAETAE